MVQSHVPRIRRLSETFRRLLQTFAVFSQTLTDFCRLSADSRRLFADSCALHTQTLKTSVHMSRLLSLRPSGAGGAGNLKLICYIFFRCLRRQLIYGHASL